MLSPATSKLGRRYGYRPPREYHRLLMGLRHLGQGGAIDDPSLKVSWRTLMRPPRDQGAEGSCFAHTVAALKEANCVFWEMNKGGPPTPLGGYLSVAYLSWRTRLAEGTFPDDSGASISDAMAVLQAYGVCPEAFLPYDQDPTQAGNAKCDVAARPYRIHEPVGVQIDPAAWRAVLLAKKVIAIGFEVHQSFEETGLDGVVPPVQPGEPLLGGHAMLVVGWDPGRGFEMRNSWGESWGSGGHCYFPEAYLSNVIEALSTA